MSCFSAEDGEEARLKYLIGPIKGLTPTEYQLYTLALCCNATKKGSVKPESLDSKKGYVGADSIDAKHSSVATSEIEHNSDNNCMSSAASCNNGQETRANSDLGKTSLNEKKTGVESDLCDESLQRFNNGINIHMSACSEKRVGKNCENEAKTCAKEKEEYIPEIGVKSNENEENPEMDTQLEPNRIRKSEFAISANCTLEQIGATLFKPKMDIPTVLHQQNFNQWKAEQGLSFNFRRMRKRKVIYVQPLEHFPDFINDFEFSINGKKKRGFFQLLEQFLSIFFFGFDVRLLDTKLIEEYGWYVRSRHHQKTGERQLLVSDIYSNMKRAIPPDGYCLLGVTWTDLYPSQQLNFVLGEASYAHKSAVFCFGRFEPKAYVNDRAPPPITAITGNLIWRMLKLISHETCHLFGLRHCVFFHCAMNESSSLQEALSQPVFLCPVCLRKIQKCAQFDLVARYKDMRIFFLEISQQFECDYFEDAIHWLEKCVYFLEHDENKSKESLSTHL